MHTLLSGMQLDLAMSLLHRMQRTFVWGFPPPPVLSNSSWQFVISSSHTVSNRIASQSTAGVSNDADADFDVDATPITPLLLKIYLPFCFWIHAATCIPHEIGTRTDPARLTGLIVVGVIWFKILESWMA